MYVVFYLFRTLLNESLPLFLRTDPQNKAIDEPIKGVEKEGIKMYKGKIAHNRYVTIAP